MAGYFDNFDEEELQINYDHVSLAFLFIFMEFLTVLFLSGVVFFPFEGLVLVFWHAFLLVLFILAAFYN